MSGSRICDRSLHWFMAFASRRRRHFADDQLFGADEQGAAHTLATAADEALAVPLPGLAGPECKPDKGRDLATVERTRL